VTVRSADALVSGIAQKEGTVQHFMVFRAGKPCGFIFRFGDNAVCVVYADFRPGVDAVLPFPEFDQPCAPPVVKIDGQGVEHHLETGRHIVIEPCVSGVPLRGVHRGGKETMVTVKTITEGVNQFIQKGTFGTAVHFFYLTDDFFPPALKEDTAENSHEK